MEELEFKIGTEKSPILVSLKTYKGRKLLDVRKYYRDRNEEDKILPTKKGISLNPIQFSELINLLNNKQVEIAQFYKENELFQDFINIDINEDVLIGRSFNLEFENNKKTMTVDTSLLEKLKDENVELFKKMILCFYDSLFDVIDEEDEVQMVLDRLSQKLKRIEW